MRVNVDLQACVGQITGVGRYVHAIWNEWWRDHGSELTGSCFNFKRRPLVVTHGTNHIRQRQFPTALYAAAWRHLGGPAYDRIMGPADWFFFPNFVAPPVNRGRTALFVHDLAFMKHPDTVQEKNLKFLERYVRPSMDRADRILCPSAAVASEIRALGVKAPVHGIWHGISPEFQPASIDAVSTTRKKFSLPPHYLLSASTLEPRKNFEFLVQVFEAMASTYTGDLVLAGGLGWKYQRLLDKIAASPFASRIHVLNYVPFADLLSLYTGADAFVFTSLYEGFGFTPLEAMACGTPVVSSTGGALREVLHGGALLMDGWDVNEWTAGIQRVLADRYAVTERGSKWVKQFTWEKAAAETWQRMSVAAD